MLIDAAFWLLHHFFDGHVREVLRVEHEAVVLLLLDYIDEFPTRRHDRGVFEGP